MRSFLVHDAEGIALAERLTGAPVLAFERRCGGNNRLAKVTTRAGSFAFKRYPAPGSDERNRLAHEFEALEFLRGAGFDDVPAPLAADRETACALFEWIEGEPPPVDDASVDALFAFLRRLHQVRRRADAARLRPAVEAVVTDDDLRAQIAERLSRLAALADAEPALAVFLRDEFAPVWAAQRFGAETTGALTLSPSDAGTHNMLLRPDGRMVFVDFEYFGWDDPVKLVADVLWHPAMRLDGALARKVRTHAADVYGDDPSFTARFQRRFPLFGLRWALIVLNEFFPARWARRQAAGTSADWPSVKAAQLEKARAFVRRANDGEDEWTS